VIICLANEITPLNVVIFAKLIVPKLNEKFPEFYGNGSFVTIYIAA
jgi:hypothetical protein